MTIWKIIGVMFSLAVLAGICFGLAFPDAPYGVALGCVSLVLAVSAHGSVLRLESRIRELDQCNRHWSRPVGSRE